MKRRLMRVPHVRAVECAVLLAPAVFLLAMTAYAVQVSQTAKGIYDQADKVAKGTPIAQPFRGRCTLADTKTAGRVLFVSDAYANICVPDGWRLYMDAAAKMVVGSAQSADGLAYEPGIAPRLAATAGAQGPFSLQLHGYSNDQGAPAAFVRVGSFRAGTVTGTEYAFTQKTTPVGGYLGNVPKGTTATEYYFVRHGHATVLDYWRFPGDPDHAAIVRQVAQSLVLF